MPSFVGRLRERLPREPWARAGLALAALAVPLHFFALTYGLPMNVVGDEFIHIDTAFRMLAERTLQADFPSAYLPPLMAYLCLPFIGLALAGGYFAGAFTSLADLEAFAVVHAPSFVTIPRFISGVFFVALLVAIFQLARAVAGRKAAYAALALAAFDFRMLVESELGHFWIPEAFFIVASLAALERMRATGAARYYVAAALLIGLGYMIGYVSVIVVPFALGYFLWSSRKNLRAAAGSAALLSGLLALASWLNPVSFLRQFGRALDTFAQAFGVSLPINPEVTPGSLDLLDNADLLLSTIFFNNPFVLALALAGIALLLYRRAWFEASLLAGFPAIYLAAAILIWNNPDYRYVLPALPFLAIGAAYGFTALLASARAPLAKGAVIALGIAALGYSMIGTGGFVRLLLVEDTRVAARAWLETNVPAGETVLIDAHYLTVNQDETVYAFLAEQGALGARDAFIRALPAAAAPESRLAAYYPGYFGGDTSRALETLQPAWYVAGHYAVPAAPAGYVPVASFANAAEGCVSGDDALGNPARPWGTLALDNLGPCITIYARER